MSEEIKKPKYSNKLSPQPTKVIITEDQVEEFYIRINYDGIRSFRQFARMMVRAYLNKDEDLLKCLTRLKKDYKIHNTKRRNKSLDLAVEGKQLESDFRLSDREIDNIYDLLDDDTDDRWYDDEDFLEEYERMQSEV